jgi:hypothetical protein
MAGFTTTLIQIGAPPYYAFVLPQRLPKMIYVGTTVMFFLVVNYVKLVPYYFLGQLQPTNLLMALVLLPLAPIGVYVGLWMQQRVTDSTVYRWANILLFATGCKLIWDGVSMLTTPGVLHG